MSKRIVIVVLFLTVSAGGWWLAGTSASPLPGVPVHTMGCCDSQPATPPAAAPAALAADEATCPVMGETHKKADMIAYAYKGVTYYFCCAGCVTKFKADPEKYIKPAA